MMWQIEVMMRRRRKCNLGDAKKKMNDANIINIPEKIAVRKNNSQSRNEEQSDVLI